MVIETGAVEVFEKHKEEYTKSQLQSMCLEHICTLSKLQHFIAVDAGVDLSSFLRGHLLMASWWTPEHLDLYAKRGKMDGGK